MNSPRHRPHELGTSAKVSGYFIGQFKGYMVALAGFGTLFRADSLQVRHANRRARQLEIGIATFQAPSSPHGGKHSRDIAVALAISPRTVEVHKAKLMAKLGVENVADLVRMSLLADAG